jgi:hypothetical protein
MVGTLNLKTSKDWKGTKMKTAEMPEMTEKELREAEARLAKTINEGNATVAQANRLAEIRRDLERIDTVKYGKSW